MVGDWTRVRATLKKVFFLKRLTFLVHVPLFSGVFSTPLVLDPFIASQSKKKQANEEYQYNEMACEILTRARLARSFTPWPSQPAGARASFCDTPADSPILSTLSHHKNCLPGSGHSYPSRTSGRVPSSPSARLVIARTPLPPPHPKKPHSSRGGGDLPAGAALLAAALLELVAAAAVAGAPAAHGRDAEAGDGLVGGLALADHVEHELAGLLLEGGVAGGGPAAGDGHDDHEGVVDGVLDVVEVLFRRGGGGACFSKMGGRAGL